MVKRADEVMLAVCASPSAKCSTTVLSMFARKTVMTEQRSIPCLPIREYSGSCREVGLWLKSGVTVHDPAPFIADQLCPKTPSCRRM